MVDSLQTYHTMILATGSVTRYVRVSKLVCLRPALQALTLQEEEARLKEGGDRQG